MASGLKAKAKRSVAVVFALILIQTLCPCLVSAQTPAEKDSLKKLGKGFVVYCSDTQILKNQFDGTGAFTHSVLVARGYNPCITDDGKYVGYCTSTSATNCDIWICNAVDGSNKRKLNAQPLSYVCYFKAYSNTQFVYTAGPLSVNTVFYRGQQMWTIDTSGAMLKMLDYVGMGNGTFANVSFEDIAGEWVTWRYNSITYTGRYKNSFLAANYADVHNFGITCGACFNPAGDMMTTNSVDHRTLTINKRSDTSWSVATTIHFPSAVTFFRWSNVENWFTATQESDNIVFAVNPQTKQIIKVTFNSVPFNNSITGVLNGQNKAGNLFFENTAPTATQRITNNGTVHAQSAVLAGNTLPHGARVVTIQGRTLPLNSNGKVQTHGVAIIVTKEGNVCRVLSHEQALRQSNH
jgi:hypothetical protein